MAGYNRRRKTRIRIWLDAKEAGNCRSRLFRGALTACQAEGTGGGGTLRELFSNWSATCSYTPAFSHMTHRRRIRKRLARRSLRVGAQRGAFALDVQGSAPSSQGFWSQSVHSPSSSSSSFAVMGSRAQISKEPKSICSSKLFAPLVFLSLGGGAGRGRPPSL